VKGEIKIGSPAPKIRFREPQIEMAHGAASDQTAVNADDGKPAVNQPAAPVSQTESSKPDPAKHAAIAKHLTHTSTSAAARSRAEKLKQKKRAEVRRAARNHQKPKPAAKAHTSAAGQGQ